MSPPQVDASKGLCPSNSKGQLGNEFVDQDHDEEGDYGSFSGPYDVSYPSY